MCCSPTSADQCATDQLALLEPGTLTVGTDSPAFPPWFKGNDQTNGKELWSTGVTGVPNASPITYAVDGKQYVAIVTGHGNPLAFGIPDVIPETQLPPVNSSALYVFALPD